MKAKVRGINPTRKMNLHGAPSFGDVWLEFSVTDQVFAWRDVHGKVINLFFFHIPSNVQFSSPYTKLKCHLLHWSLPLPSGHEHLTVLVSLEDMFGKWFRDVFFSLVKKNYDWMVSPLPPPVPTSCCSRTRCCRQQERQNLPGGEDMRILKHQPTILTWFWNVNWHRNVVKVQHVRLKIHIIIKVISSEANSALRTLIELCTNPALRRVQGIRCVWWPGNLHVIGRR